MPRRSGSKATKKDPSRALQKSFDPPGSRDPLSPLEPPVPLDVDDDVYSDSLDNIIIKGGCRGVEFEEIGESHDDPIDVAEHLELFLRHTQAARKVKQYGVDLCNAVLRELPHAGEKIENLAGFFNWRLKELKKTGASALDPPLDARTLREIKERGKYLRDYERFQRRRGEL